MVWQGFRLWLPQQQVFEGGAVKQWLCCISYLDQALWHTEWKHKIKTLWLSSQPTIHSDIADSCVLPLVFLSSLSILSGCPVINICSCHQNRKLSWVGLIQYDPHTGFHYCKLLTYLCHDCGSFSNISGMDLGGSEYRQVSKLLFTLDTLLD